MKPDLAARLQVVRPDGSGPFAVVVQMHAIDRVRRDGLDLELMHLSDPARAFDDNDAIDPRMTYRPDYEALLRAHYASMLTAAPTSKAPGMVGPAGRMFW